MKYKKYLLVTAAILFFTMIPASAQQNWIDGRVKFDTVKSGILMPDMTLWYDSASLMATPEIHKKITKGKP